MPAKAKKTKSAAAAERRQASGLAAERREREKRAAPQPEPVVIGARHPQAAASTPAASAVKTTHKPKRKKPSRPEEPRYAAPAGAKKT